MIKFDDMIAASTILILLTIAAFPPTFFVYGVIPVFSPVSATIVGLVCVVSVLSCYLVLFVNGGFQ